MTPLVGVEIGEKYHFHNYTLFVVLIGIFSHLNALYSNYFRVINRLNEIVFCQSVIPVSVFCLLFFFKGETLLNLILWAMLIGNITALILFLSRERLQTFKPDFSLMQPMIKKAFFLFLYNTFFYLILLSTRTIVSEQYSAVEFGLFTFSYTMANSIVLLFDSFSFLIYPKAINRFSKADSTEVLRIVDLIRKNYITSIHFVMYLFILLFPLIILFFPQYSSIFECFALITLTVVLYSNCFPYSSYLIAMGKEKLLSALSGVVLALNVLFALYISLFLKTGYEYVILATLLSYFIYNILLVFFSNRLLIDIMTFGKFLRLTFPARLFVPFFIILGLVLFDASYICYFFVWGLFVLLNKNQLKEIMITLKKIAQDSSVINV
ncbi:hypothetical protein [Massilibacteroides sp.]|uniref:hypothetical protein n=1 Tax=Massilibacteroides sp. TaxID=2034766 RepID=UPI00262A8B74|nr:hypothetical protein [Massilibacteroides sp.]